MNVGQTTAPRDQSIGGIGQAGQAAQPVQPASPQASDSFGPATKVEIGHEARSSAGPTPLENVISIDQTTRSVVFQSRNATTGDVVFQVPDESKLRLRAYLDEVAQHQAASATAGTHPDPAHVDAIRV